MTDLLERVRRRMAVESIGVEAAVRSESDGILDEAVLTALRRDVEAEIAGAGPIEPLLALAGVTDVLVTAPDEVWIDRGGGLERTAVGFADEAAVRRLAQRLATAAGRRLDDAQPFVDAALPDGTRLHAVLPPIAPWTTLSLRVLRRERFDLDALERSGMFDSTVRELLVAAVSARLTLLISGGTGSGKTTLLGALLGLAPPSERLVVIEDARELVVDHPHVVRLATRSANVEGGGVVGPATLVGQALRMRPDRIVVGEFRGAEILELLVALNSGHEGGAATVHANSASDVVARCVALGALGGVSGDTMRALLVAGVDLIVHLRRVARTRVVSEIAALSPVNGGTADRVWGIGLGVGGGVDRLAALFDARRVSPPGIVR